jgi:hypothetical protein
MNGSIIVAIVFGLAMGTLLLVMGHILTGLFILGLTVFVILFMLAVDTSARLLVASIAAVVCSGALGYFAARSEITGKAVDYRFHARFVVAHPVTRDASPDTFRQATNYKWALSIVCASIGAGCFMFRRRLDSSDLF